MEFANWVRHNTNEDWNNVGKFIGNFPQSAFDLSKNLRNRRALNKSKLEKITSVQIEEAKTWLERLKNYAEKGREQLNSMVMEPDASVVKRIKGEEEGDPFSLLLKRSIGYLGEGLYKVVHVLLMKVLHLPAMWKFFRHDSLRIGKDFLKSGWMLAKHPTRLRAWGAFGYHFLNLLRLPVAAFMMGVGAKFTYQQYQLVHALGFTDIDLSTLAAANAILCWALFLCFLFSHWFSDAEHRLLKTVALILRSMFPQQMYKRALESINKVMDKDLNFLCEDVSRYSIEVNYRTSKKEVLDAWAKLVLGFTSAALQKEGYHVKHVYSEKPMRILVSTNNWDDGAWTALLMYNHNQECFVISSGFWNKDRRTISIQRDTGKCAEDTASALVNKMLNFMYELRRRDPRKINTLKPARMKRGPKK